MLMNIWHDTTDTPRIPRRVSPGEQVDIIAGTWPIAHGQSVWVTWQTVAADGGITEGKAACAWTRNTDVNSYWTGRIGPFADGDRVTYTVHGSSPDGTAQTAATTVTVKPALYIAWLWHQHQPLYRDPNVPESARSYRYPWVRLHALRDYYSMAALAGEHDVHVTINLTPVLVHQIDEYLDGATDNALELTRRPAESLNASEIEEVLETFFDADWHNQVFIHPRYRELFEQRTRGGRFSRHDVRDLQMWFNLAWFGHEFRVAPVRLVTGDTVNVERFVRQRHGYSHDDVLAMIEDQFKILRAVIPIHRALQDAAGIEVSTTPAFHPILPLLIDTERAVIDRQGTSHPTRFAYPEDAAVHIERAHGEYVRRFGRSPRGMWPAEGAVSADAVRMIGRQGIKWVATDSGVLARSGRWGYETSQPSVLCQPYRVSDDRDSVAMFFRETDLSDGIGFRFGRYADANAAVDDFIRTIEARFLTRFNDDEDRILTIALDGENAWGGYRDDGRPFLHALYQRLASDARLKTVTFSEYLRGNPARGIEPHPVNQLTRVYDLATGSWIDEPGSAPGVDLGTWIGEPEENAAWNLLGQARSLVAAAGDGPSRERAYQSLLAAEGSDWFWWFGGDQESRNDAAFDELFRAHLRGAYEALGVEVPGSLDEFIIAHPVVWSFTHPVPSLRWTNQVSIRTNCPGRLEYWIDSGPERVESLVAVGGVMAGARRFQVTLGPFVEGAKRLVFRFVCEHPGCEHDSPCCRGEEQAIALGASKRTRKPSRGTGAPTSAQAVEAGNAAPPPTRVGRAGHRHRR